MRKERLVKGITVLFLFFLVHGFVFCMVNSASATAFNLVVGYDGDTGRLQVTSAVGEKLADVPAKSEYSGAGEFNPCAVMLIKAKNFGAGYPNDALVFFGSQGQTLAAFYLSPGDGERVANWLVYKVSDKKAVDVRDVTIILH